MSPFCSNTYMTKMQTLILSLLLTCVYSNTPDLIDYYEKLIQNEIKRSKTFSPPTSSHNEKPFSKNYIEYGTFDHIIVGAGSAGAVIANRLSEDPFRQVLLLEAGGHPTNFTDIPGMATVLLNLEYNWNYYTVPQTTSCLGMTEQRCPYPRGKMLGGSSGINAAIYTRGSRKDFDNWCAQGSPGWCYKDVLPFFKMLENSQINGDPIYHGYDGYINVEYTKPNTRQQLAFIAGHRELNHPFVDYNGFQQEGVGITQMNLKNGRRCSTAGTYLKAASKRENLRILTHSYATKILINRKSKKAVGVLFARNNRYYVARSRKDIIISAGVIGSPQLLMLSGIGPRLHLQQLGISVIEDLSVGENFQDHVSFGMLNFETNYPEYAKSLTDNVRDYLNGFGTLSEPFNAKGIAFVRTNLTKIDDFADIELLLMGTNSTASGDQRFFNYADDTLKLMSPTENLSRFFTILIILLHPESRGNVKLKSPDPFDYPLIDLRPLSDPNFKDIETVYQGIQLTLKLLDTKAFKNLDARLYRVHLPACKQFQYMSKDYWYCHIRQVSSTVSHPVGTCKMGPDRLRGAVVDHQLKVYGIQNLRVADASIMPLIPGAHTNAPSMMVGEKAAHMIKELL